LTIPPSSDARPLQFITVDRQALSTARPCRAGQLATAVVCECDVCWCRRQHANADAAMWGGWQGYGDATFCRITLDASLLCPRPRGDFGIARSVRLSVPWRSCLGYRHAGCLQFSHVRTADRSTDGRRSAASRTAIGGRGYIVSPRPGDTLLIAWCWCCVLVCLQCFDAVGWAAGRASGL